MPAMHINTMRPAHHATVLVREQRAPQCGQALALVLSPLHSGHFFTVIAAPSLRLTPPSHADCDDSDLGMIFIGKTAGGKFRMFLDALAGPAAGAARRKAVRKAAGRKRLKEATFGETQTPKGHRPNASALDMLVTMKPTRG
jgi:hypothetical protein